MQPRVIVRPAILPPPPTRALTTALAQAAPAWDALLSALQEKYDPLSLVWKSAKREFGYSCKLVHKKRTLLYLVPDFGEFEVVVVLGPRAVRLALASRFPAAISRLIEHAPTYVEGRLLRLPVRSAHPVPAILKLVRIKLTPP